MLDVASVRSRVAGSNPCVIEQIDLSDSLQQESVTGVQSRRVHVVHTVISTGLPVPCLITRIYWVAPRLLTRDSLSTDLHNDSFGESEYQVGSSAKILLQSP